MKCGEFLDTGLISKKCIGGKYCLEYLINKRFSGKKDVEYSLEC